jgi:ADP-ribosyl-[dinitrogen reductase] hydrolase
MANNTTGPGLVDRYYPIATLPLASGWLGLAHCPGTVRGRRQVGEPRLCADIAATRDWQARQVISLIETTEMEALGVSGLGRAMQTAGIDWRHLPIPDFRTPDAQTMQLWQALSPQLHGILNSGGRVLLHCRAGLGRSGTMAALILTERGMTPDAAIAAVRSVRPGAVETARQEQWLRQQCSG